MPWKKLLVWATGQINERNHQGLANVIPCPDARTGCQVGTIHKAKRLGGLLNFYHRAA
jgi:hypothetical protein